MMREIPLTIRQLQLFRDAEKSSQAKIRAINDELSRNVQMIGAGIVAGHEEVDLGATVDLLEWRGDPPRLIVETSEPELPPDTPPDA